MISSGRLDDAKAAARAMLSLNPKDAQALNALGVAALRANDPAAAFESLSAAASLAPGDPDIRTNVGQAYYQINDFERAAESFEASNTLYRQWTAAAASSQHLNPKLLAQVHRRIGSVLELASASRSKLGQWDRAVPMLREAAMLYRTDGHEKLLGVVVKTLADAEMVCAIKPALAAGVSFPNLDSGYRDTWERSAAQVIASNGAVMQSGSPAAVFYHVDSGGKHPFLNHNDTIETIDYGRTLAHAVDAARNAVPGLKVLVITDASTKLPAVKADGIARLPVERDRMMFSRMRAYRAAIMSGVLCGPTLLLDTDIFLTRDFTALFDGTFDIGWTYRTEIGKVHMPINEGVILADLRNPAPAAKVFAETLALYEWLAESAPVKRRYGFDIRHWRGGQLSLAAYADWTVPPVGADLRTIKGVRCRFLPCETYNFPVKTLEAEKLNQLSDKWALHFKGALAKETMQRLAALRTNSS